MDTATLFSNSSCSGHQRSTAYVIGVCVVTILLTVIGFTGNLAVILTIVLSPRLRRKMKHYFILSLAVSDLLVSGMVCPLATAAIIIGGWALDKSVCDLVGVVLITCILSALLKRLAVALNRFFCVLYPVIYLRIYSKKGTIAQIALIWTLSALMALMPIFGVGHYHYDRRIHICLINWRSHKVITVIGVMIVPLLANVGNIVCYSAIFKKVYQSKKRMARHSITSATAPANINQMKPADLNLILQIFSIFLVFNVCYLPYMVVIGLEVCQDRDVPDTVVLAAGIMTFFTYICNPAIHFSFNSILRSELRGLLSGCCVPKCRRSTSQVDIEPEATTQI